MSMDGYLLVDKPTGLTSHDVVAKIRRILNQGLPTTHYPLSTSSPKVKVGHTGTLDPLASGLLILVLGSYTKRAQEFSKMDKTYKAEITLGAVSATGDGEGPIEKVNTRKPSIYQIKNAIAQFIGNIDQAPHAHSAVKIGGQRAYKLARAGKEVKIESRKVTIHSIGAIEYKYPKLNFVTNVSSGTYIRSLAEDIGQKLGTGAYVSSLRRTKVGKYNLKDAIPLHKFSKSAIITLQS